MKNSFLLLLVSLPYFSIAQNQEVESWKRNHPNVLCIDETDASEALLNRLEENGVSYINIFRRDLNRRYDEIRFESNSRT